MQQAAAAAAADITQSTSTSNLHSNAQVRYTLYLFLSRYPHSIRAFIFCSLFFRVNISLPPFNRNLFLSTLINDLIIPILSNTHHFAPLFASVSSFLILLISCAYVYR